METITKKRSVPLTRAQVKLLKEYRKGFTTEVACATSIGIDRNVLQRVILAGSGSPDTIKKIKTALGIKQEDSE